MNKKFKAAGILAATVTIAAMTLPSASAAGRGMMNGNGSSVRITASGSSTCTGTGAASGAVRQMAGRGSGGMGRGYASGMQGQTHVTAPMGTLTPAQKTELLGMVEEEKLAHDVYIAISAKFPTLTQFARIANSEAQHQTALRSLLTKYGMADPTANLAAGKFVTAAMQDLYGQLLASATSTNAALAVGVSVEKLDIADLTDALSGLTAPDVQQVYTNLRSASQRHLAAFGG